MNIAIIGSGNIGTDLLVKVMKSTNLNCVLFIGRRPDSPGINYAKKLGIATSTDGLEALKKFIANIDLVFDCSSAASHLVHWDYLKHTKVRVIDLTPSNIGTPIVPAVNLYRSLDAQNISLVTCGGQGAIPLAHAITSVIDGIDYIEVVNTIASKSAGPATRNNLDEYLTTTENVLSELTGIQNTKSILILNPAEPCINMKTTVFVMTQNKFSKEDGIGATEAINQVVSRVELDVPGYRVLVLPTIDVNKLLVTIEVVGEGDYLPAYAGNLDIITAAAISVAEFVSQEQKRVVNG